MPVLAGEASVRLVPQTELTDQAGTQGAEESEPKAVVTGIPLSTGLQLRSADDLLTPFTNYVRGYSGLLDYIW